MSAPTLTNVNTKLRQIAILARLEPGLAFVNLAHLITPALLKEAHRLTRKDGAPGVDRQTAQDYGENLEDDLLDLWQRTLTGTYKAPPVRRVHIPKDGKGKTRPIAVPTFEDKVLQRAVSLILEAIYEEDFLDCSYGFRPKRSQHQALENLWQALMAMRGGWVLEVDIKGFFDNLDHTHLRSILDLRVRDRGIRRLIDKWLKAGVLEGGELSHPEAGTPQGGVISPILSNIYLHEVLDKWFAEVVRPRLAGQAYLVRFADDWVAVFSCKSDAERVMSAVPKRLARFGLAISEEKTRLARFEKPAPGARTPDCDPFDSLGFTHYWGKSRKRAWVVRRKTAKSRLKRSLQRIREWCRINRHRPLADQHRELCRKAQGHYAYYGITHNLRALAQFGYQVIATWWKWLRRRSRKARSLSWEKMQLLLKRYPLPPPRVVHSALRAANP